VIATPALSAIVARNLSAVPALWISCHAHNMKLSKKRARSKRPLNFGKSMPNDPASKVPFLKESALLISVVQDTLAC
jgi:hypothetical protein